MDKAQDCRLCGSRAKIIPNYGAMNQVSQDSPTYCTNEECIFHCSGYDAPFLMDLKDWNRMRFAPDDKNVEITNKYDTDIRDWMNPRYPDETKEGE